MFSVSVVIPTFNRASTLERAVRSVYAQRRRPDEVIVVDDASIDDSAELLARLAKELTDPPLNIVVLAVNRGVSFARNVGIAQARSEWIAFLDSDDEWLPEKLARQSDFLSSHRALPLVHCDEIWIRNGVRVNPMRKHEKSGGRIFLRCLDMCRVSPSAVIVKKELLERVGRFREDFPVCEDFALWLRICAQTDIGYIAEPLLRKFGGHADQLSRAYVAMDYWRIRALAEVADDPNLSADERSAVRATIAKKATVLLSGYQKHGNMRHADEISELCARLIVPRFDADSNTFRE